MLRKLLLKSKQIIFREIIRKEVPSSVFYTGSRLNIGDSMVPWLVKKVSGQKLAYSNPLEARGPHLFSIGSVLQYATSDCDIWGSGFISVGSECKSKPSSVYAVRGPLTGARLNQLYGIEVYAYGDPALLTPLYIKPRRIGNPKYKVGVIPHYADKKFINQLDSSQICVIDVETDDIQKFVDDVSNCEVIFSSSLHGIILSEAFGLRAHWIEFGTSVAGDGFKFRDYYQSTNRTIEPIKISSHTNLLRLSATISGEPLSAQKLEDLQQGLLKTFPSGYRKQ
ncbi:polysaccharide pyruvyl transferase family protein [Pseudidiomarina sp. 1APP75-27a]|uniref:polysaccharide pyruvyl transferase family protein n=1 Tax=Pseudidiomarina terrestris TaxID=2820060 RepID=UPI002B052746|nr:polysaccharide pyruvyl transferase family protein [Pseudidiomarina sp. 1APP75-27a]MEA3587674.1 polysaccharide pyruvyl transferase family protein [Pseudidiomarina sp. 1APP75-27a]